MRSGVDGIAHNVGLQTQRSLYWVLFSGHHQADPMARLFEHATDEQNTLRLVIDRFDDE